MGEPARKRATYDDLVSVPEELIAEILDGELMTMPRPVVSHANVSSNLGGELHNPFRRGRGGPGGWILLDEPEIHLRGDALVPDLAGWRRERLPTLPEGAAIELAPNWVCEVLSPSTAARDRVRKMPIYAREGVAHAWLIDPAAQTLEAYRLEGGRWMVVGTWTGDDLVRVEPFDAAELELGALWAR